MIPYDDEEELDLELSDDDSAASEGDKEEQKGTRDTVTSNKEGSVSAASSEDIQYCQFPDCKFSCLCPKELAGHQKSKGHSNSVSAPTQISEEDKNNDFVISHVLQAANCGFHILHWGGGCLA